MPSIDFERAVLERSHAVPVVVDFWAPWCAPCRVLGPVIERLAAGAQGRWELAKLNTDEQPDIAQAFGIQSIPAVKMFQAGRVIAEFVGARPEAEIRRWLDASIPDPRLQQLSTTMEGWETSDAGRLIGELEQFVRDNEDLAVGRLRLAQLVVGRDPQRARELVTSTEADPDLAELAGDIASLADLMECVEEIPPRLEPFIKKAQDGLRDHDLDATLGNLVEVAMRDKRFGNELARRSAVALFRLLGQRHGLTEKHQRQLSMALHS
jgi:putative thioredoxin